jgi:hypothetical protein
VIDMRRAAKSHRRDEIIHCPAHLAFSWMPQFANVALVDGAIVYHWGENGESSLRDCPVTHDPVRIALIDDVFDIWKAKLRSKPSKETGDAVRRAPVDRSDPVSLICHYVLDGDPHYLFDVLGAPDTDDIVLWVDHGEEDDAIVSSCAAILGLSGLTARFVDHGDGFALELARDDRVTLLDYGGGNADRDTTLVALDAALRLDYELRYCRDSGGSSIAALLPLPREQWIKLERDYPNEVALPFDAISSDAPLLSE